MTIVVVSPIDREKVILAHERNLRRMACNPFMVGIFGPAVIAPDIGNTSMSLNMKADICVIGAGSAGLSIASVAAQLGAKVILVERDRMGGECLNSGCIPSKALLAASKVAYHPECAFIRD